MGFAAASSSSLLGGCADSYNTPDSLSFWKAGNYLPVSSEIIETILKIEGRSQTLELAKGAALSEPLYIPAQDGNAEDDGYVFSYVYEPSTQTSDL